MKKFLDGEASVPVVALLSVATTIIIGVTGFFFSVNGELAQRLNSVQEVNTTQTASLAANSETIKALDERLDDMDKQLDRIEAKLTGQPLSKIQGQ